PVAEKTTLSLRAIHPDAALARFNAQVLQRASSSPLVIPVAEKTTLSLRAIHPDAALARFNAQVLQRASS
ncbi:hypothetical protein CK247_31355, partial [Klebsiella pneumoniae]